MIYLCVKSTRAVEDGGYHLPAWNILLSYGVWIMATRTAKLLPHLWFRPQDIIYVPAFILFGYYFAIMKIYALFTLHETGWGTRQGVGAPADANEAEDERNEREQYAAPGSAGAAAATLGYQSKEQPRPAFPHASFESTGSIHSLALAGGGGVQPLQHESRFPTAVEDDGVYPFTNANGYAYAHSGGPPPSAARRGGGYAAQSPRAMNGGGYANAENVELKNLNPGIGAGR